MTAEQASQEPKLTIEQFAAVQAALEDGFPESEVLEVEGLDPSLWQEGRAEVLEAMSTEPKLTETYEEALAACQDNLRCDVTPLFEDLQAWVGFLLLMDDTSLADITRSFDMTTGDLARLERHWRKRFDEDDAVAKEARELRNSDDPPAPPDAVELGDRKLKPSPFASAQDDGHSDTTQQSTSHPDAEASDNAPVDLEDINRMAALQAYLKAGLDVGVLRRRFDFRDETEANARLEVFRSRLDRDMAGFYRQRVAHFERLAVNRMSAATNDPGGPSATSPSMYTPASTPSPSPTAATPVDFAGTSLLDPKMFALAPLPFIDDGAGAAAEAPAPVADELAPHEQQGETGWLNPADFQNLASTPFKTPGGQTAAQPEQPLPVPPDAQSPRAPETPSLGSSANFGQETAAMDQDALAAVVNAIPFHQDGASASPQPSATPDEPAPDMGGTGFIDHVALAQAVTPFSEESVIEPGETSFIDPTSIPLPPGSETPFQPDANAAPPPSSTSSEAESHVAFGETGMLDPAQFAHLAPTPFDEAPTSSPRSGLLEDLQLYASFSVELVQYEGHEEAVRHRYGLASEADHRAITESWNARLASEPELRHRYHQAIKTYRDWLKSQGENR